MGALDSQDAGADHQRMRRHSRRSSTASCCSVHVCAKWIVRLTLLAAAQSSSSAAATATSSTAAVTAAIDFDALTWSQWAELHDAAAAAMTLERVYKRGPHVRAKVLVATHISMSEFLAGDAIFRQQLGDVAGTSVARVQLEFLQTSALRESDRGVYSAAFSISALPDPLLTLSNNSSAALSGTLTAAIEHERERIVESLRFGSIVRGRNVTVANLSLFGSAAQLVDVALDGETFYPIDLKPWIAARLAVVPATSSIPLLNATSASTSTTTTTDSSTNTGASLQTRYTPSRDAYQNLRLRFLVAKTLLPLRITTFDILVRESLRAPPFASYYSSAASVVEVEVHMRDERFRAGVDGYLRSASLPQAFSAAEPQWVIAAIDVDPVSGILFSPPSDSAPLTSAPALTTASAVEVTFTLENVPFARVESRKWRVLEQVAALVTSAGCTGCRVAFARVATTPTEEVAFATHNDGDATDDDAGSSRSNPSLSQALDPINARSTTLIVSVDATQGTLAAQFFASLQTQIALGTRADMCVSIGVAESSELAALALAASSPLSCALTRYDNVSAVASPGVSPPSSAASSEPFVALNLTLALSSKALNASVTPDELAVSAFMHHRVRCALLVLLQQVAVFDAHVRLASTTVLSSEPAALALYYRVAVQDESQRRGIAQHVLSKRMVRTVATYSNQLLSVLLRDVDIHADGSPHLEDKLPGFDVALLNMSSVEGVDSSQTASRVATSTSTRVYHFQDPVLLATSGSSNNTSSNATSLQTNASAVANASLVPTSCPLGDSTALTCVSLRFTSELGSAAHAVFLRQIESSAELSSHSLVLPVPTPLRSAVPAAASTLVVPAPWIASHAAALPWVFYVNTTPPLSGMTTTTNASSAALTLRFEFEVVRRASATGSDWRTLAAFALELRVVATTHASNSSSGGGRSLTVHKSGFLPLSTTTALNDMLFDTDRQVVDPFVTAELLPQATTATAAFTIRQSSVGGFFAREQRSDAASPTSCSTCFDALETCDASLECRALATCVGAFANANPALYASLLGGAPLTGAASALDISWLLEQCLASSSDDSDDSGGSLHHSWTRPTLTLFLDGLRCVSANRCAVATSNTTTASAPEAGAAFNRSLVLRHSPVEQTLTFAHDTFAATLQFLVAVDASSSAQSLMLFANFTAANASLAELASKLVELYSGQASSAAGSALPPIVTVTRAVSSSTSTNTTSNITIAIQYFFLAAWTSLPAHRLLPAVQSLSGDIAVVTTTRQRETLELVVLDL